MDDKEIIVLFNRRDERAIAETSRKYSFRLRSLACRIVEDEETAKECENDTYLEAWKNIPPHDPSEYYFAYLARITRHLAIDVCRRLRAKKRSCNIVTLSEELQQCLSTKGDELEETIIADELAGVISEFLRSLPKQQRQIFVRRYWYMNSIEELSKMFACSESKIKSILFRVRGRLKLHLEKAGYRI